VTPLPYPKRNLTPNTNPNTNSVLNNPTLIPSTNPNPNEWSKTFDERPHCRGGTTSKLFLSPGSWGIWASPDPWFSSGQPESIPQTAPRSVHLFCRARGCDQQTDTQIHRPVHRPDSIGNNRPHIMLSITMRPNNPDPNPSNPKHDSKQ